MQKSDINQTAKTIRRQIKSSTTLSRKYLKRPVSNRLKATEQANSNVVTTGQNQPKTKISRFVSPITENKRQKTQTTQPIKAHPTQTIANERLRERRQQTTQKQSLTAKELKDQAIKKALLAASKQTQNETIAQQIQSKKAKKEGRIRFGFKRVALALSCATAVIFAIIYFVNLNMPDIQFRATAMQLNATYPNYLPYNYFPYEISSENDTVILYFKNNVTEGNFTITEEKSSWDSNSLLNNYVKRNYGENYSIIREQGLTIYVGQDKATWVNGGVVYKIEMKKGSLSKKQITEIAVSF